MTSAATPLDVPAARSALEELRRLERELVELELLRRRDALDLVGEALRRLADVGSPDGLLERAAAELGRDSRFDRVLVCQLRDRELVARSLWAREQPDGGAALLAELAERPIALEYPLVEAEVVRGQRSETVDVAASGARSPAALRELLGWDHYVVAPLALRGSPLGLLHAGRCGDGPLDAVDAEVARVYADGLAGSFERASLRATLARHREELRGAVRWMDAHLEHAGGLDQAAPAPDGDEAEEPGVDALTPREREVLQLLGGGRTNAAIARSLVVSESTVKYHVKNILRKLQATSRADAVAKHLRSGR